MPAKKLNFESAMGRLQEIVERLESGEAPLEEAMALFEEGAKLSALCYNTLDRAQLKVTELAVLPGEAESDG
ncbi:exodeoxyribonuclease VII small subunit [Acutalibacter muris]|jgi:exodeoxyribonuclease VII small subunit|uniref:Exodeoxyribonuclease 7 small subunit n=1 Tax=Acutalibacter muris TaxID=1796620 RepID=A0A1Z2XNI3_9FIRM|nr:exodeoxyribonuclease VII small subunit [Acutalibacter muris]ANU53325.1 exodeoxyribonuclease VII small subunit [Hungateiclostridiaceae bacterium KB18]ASB40003.1 exodeoxyribonuclease VII small subunit [Acutalibacter muris]MCI9191831.1 exodeoxyribonuclease VII small subunit [Acutalibacter muris]MCI9542673.1 exodeoxyribonuclease VII small subunit [Acutalibacter muris]QQR29291.1 exodeoxyribonuclease VII small subunit [Acutalibacter muris]